MSQKTSQSRAAVDLRELQRRAEIDPREALYRWTGNPMHAVHAYRWARHLHLEIPAWILDAFDALDPDDPKLHPSGGPNLESQALTDWRDRSIILDVKRLTAPSQTVTIGDTEVSTIPPLRKTGPRGAFEQVRNDLGTVTTDTVLDVWYKRFRRKGDPF